MPVVPRQRVAVQVEEVKKGKVKKKKNVIELDGTLCGSSLQLFLERLRMFWD